MQKLLSSVLLLFLLTACTDILSLEQFTDEVFQLSVDSRLPMDENGFYHLTLNTTSTQTIHRITGRLLKNGKEPNPPEKVLWESSHVWTLTDSIGYVIRRVIDYRGRWTNVDTLVIRGFNNQIVPTINCCSYSGTNGEVNTIIAPIQEMRGDTMLVRAWFYTHNEYINIILK